MIVALDGPAGSGKTTICDRISQDFGLILLRSGLLYRALTKEFIENEENIEALLASHGESWEEGADVLLNTTAQQMKIYHTKGIDEIISRFSAIPEVRDIVNRVLVGVAQHHNVIAEGRDMTTVVFPDADVKIYLDASLEVRAQRRKSQFSEDQSLDKLKDDLARRDGLDKKKGESSLRVGENVTIIDSSLLTLEETCAKVRRVIVRFITA